MNSIRNKDGLWINSNVFREEAIHYEKYGFYCPDPYLSYGWKEYWDEQRQRCLEGYEVGGVKITGNHYAYLNFCEIYDKSAGQSKFPDFWDGDFDFFWFLDIARYGIKESELKKLHLEATPTHLDGDRHFMMAKCRQRGFTWKLASIASNTFNHLRKTQTLLGAYDKGYLYKGGVWDRTLECLNFVNTHTGWKFGKAKSDSAYQRKGFVEYVDGIPVEGGFQSELFAVTFHQTASAARGKVPYYVIFEEAGEWPGLDSAYMATRPGCEEGGKLTGQIIVGGCVCAGTKVWDVYGKLVNIEDIKPNRGILGYAGNSVSQEPITYIQEPKVKKCYRITTSGGNTLECSYDHPLMWSKNRWVKDRKKLVTFKRAQDIQVGDQLMMLPSIPVFGDYDVFDARLLGMLLGDGHYSGNGSIELAVLGEDVLDFLKKHYTISIYKDFITKDNNTYYRVGILNIRNVLREFGMFGQTKGEKQLPDRIHLFSKESIQEFLGGYFNADGNVSYSKSKNTVRVSLTSKYLHLLEDVKFLLHKLNIDSSIYKENRGETGYGTDTHIYRLYITRQTEVLNFYKQIYFTDKYKQETLAKVVNLKKRSRQVYSKCLFELNEENNKGTYYTQIPHLENLRTVYVTNIEEIGEQPVYNLTAGTTHTYITNGFVSGNTGGDMSKASIPFSDMFYNPDAYNLLAFENIWDDDSGEGKCAFFFPENLCNKSFMDDIGNSFMEEAKEFELEERKKLMVASGGTVSMAKRLSEHPLKPSEAFLVDSVNDFPVELLQAQLSKIRSSEKLSRLGKVYELKYLENKIVAEPDLKGKKTPLVHYRQKSLDQSGAVVIYELPPPNPPPGLYFIGYDPYRHDKSQTDSLGSCYVWKGYQEYSATGDTIVAEYVGRPKTTDDCDEIILRLAKLYNAQVMYENEVLNTKTYFTYNNALDFLALEPSNIISSIVPNSKVDRKFGVHMSPKIKEACEKYAKRWLLTPRGTREDGTKILNLHVLYSIGLLEELIKYNRTDNFDRVMSFFMVMIAIQDNDSKSRETQSRESKVIDQLLNMSKYKK